MRTQLVCLSLTAALTATGCILVVVPPPAPVRRAFEITGLDELFGDRQQRAE